MYHERSLSSESTTECLPKREVQGHDVTVSLKRSVMTRLLLLQVSMDISMV
jgi:hypothetical protein